jgi:hypothetical protein
MHQVTGSFSDPKAAERAMRDLVESHFSADEISIVVTDREGRHAEEVEHDTGIAEGATGGAALGGALGSLGFALVATGVVVAAPAEHDHAEHARKVFRDAGADEVRG